ncbi:hypothetical protein COCNU_07G010020 [Cocos nucifera]|uniref:protein-serine/threonine phosphatase n=1 Tax=Cocos nucifera TaxID=13894 RepID=A0A8K0N4M8_COCNU|nr:hypothetical protein COCNU_07G010020 [Cocos nucifera]
MGRVNWYTCQEFDTSRSVPGSPGSHSPAQRGAHCPIFFREENHSTSRFFLPKKPSQQFPSIKPPPWLVSLPFRQIPTPAGDDRRRRSRFAGARLRSQPLMGDIYVKMVDEGDSPAKCREARRRRIEMRRFAAVAGDSPSMAGSPSRRMERKRELEPESAASDPANSGGEKRSRPAGDDSPSPPLSLTHPSPATPSSPPPTTSSPVEADAAPAISSSSGQAPAGEPRLAFGSISLSGRSREMEDAISVRPGFFRPPGGGSTLHFFAVFDGHGGSHVSALCSERMHVMLAEELAAAEGEEQWRAAVARTFGRMDELALTACVCGSVGYPLCRCERSGIESDIVGSTAVVAVVSHDRLLVANCGDSRAVLSRGGRAVPLSSDQKPDRPDELARIEAAGGRVIYLNGARVHGILAMSRAIGMLLSLAFPLAEIDRTAATMLCVCSPCSFVCHVL